MKNKKYWIISYHWYCLSFWRGVLALACGLRKKYSGKDLLLINRCFSRHCTAYEKLLMECSGKAPD